MNGRTLIVVLSLNILVCSVPVKRDAEKATCNSCHPTIDGKINIHLIPHSHDDVGWLKTVDQYYYGSGVFNNYEDAGVQYIISSAVAALRSHPERRYVQVETAFFWKWWQNQNDQVKQDVLDLVNNGQLEIINGAWSMNDEAASHYHSTIDQYTWGFRILNDTLGNCGRPKIGWQIDPFGHSREQASLLKQMGFRGLIIGRIDYRDKENRRLMGNLDFLWKSSDNLDNPYIFTSMFPDFYVSESGFCFDMICNEKPINDDEESPDYNLKQKVDQFAQRMDTYTYYYSTSNLLIPMGGDFNYQAAEINFLNLDKLIKGFKNHTKYNVFYSTPSCYIEAVNEELNKKPFELTIKSDDFFPYASDAHSYWTGYFTSRPTSKRYERLGNNILQCAKELAAFSKINGDDVDSTLNDLRSAIGIMQHHDAITGTEKQAVADDYARLVHKGLKKAEAPVGSIIGNLLKKDVNAEVDLQLSTCLLANVSICLASQQEKFIVAVQNPLSRNITHYVRLPVDSTNYRITGPDGEEIYDVFDTIHSFEYIEEDIKPSNKELVFAARNLPPLGIKIYYVEKSSNFSNAYRPFTEVKTPNDAYFGNLVNGFMIDLTTGKLSTVIIKSSALDITQDFFYYTGFSGNNGGAENRASGAYIFRPTEWEANPLVTNVQSFRGAKGDIVDEFLQLFNEEITQIIRVYKSDNDAYIEFDWLVGNLQYVDHRGKEVITRFTVSGFTNEGVFYTDSNGREQIRRELNRRSNYQYDPLEEPIASNYYPVTSKIVIKDENQGLEVAVLNDRAQGGSSLTEGSIELMIHRRCTRDDAFGVGEILNERQYGVGLYARGQHYLTFGSLDYESDENGTSTTAFVRELAQRKLLQPWILVSDATVDELNSLEKVQSLINFQFDGLQKSLPVNVQILTFEPWKDDTYILRLEHILEKDDDVNLSKPVNIDLKDLFTTCDIISLSETTLGANQLLDDYNNEEKLIWNGIIPTPLTRLDSTNPLQIELSPMQIRTFIIKVAKK